jgi:hypothetical protein
LKWEPEQPYIWNNLAAVWMMAGAFEQAQQGLVSFEEN